MVTSLVQHDMAGGIMQASMERKKQIHHGLILAQMEMTSQLNRGKRYGVCCPWCTGSPMDMDTSIAVSNVQVDIVPKYMFWYKLQTRYI